MVRWGVILIVAAGLVGAGAGAVVAGGDRDAAGPRAHAAKTRAFLGAVRLVRPGGRHVSRRWQRWADRSLVPTVRGRVVVSLRRCPALPYAAGCVYIRRPRHIYLKPNLPNPRGVLLHELGHVYDLKVFNNRDRGRFRKIVHGTPHRRWWKGSLPLAEQFAEAYSWCARYPRIVSIERYSSYGYRPTGHEHRRVCRLIRHAARDRARPAPAPSPPVVTGPDPVPPPQPDDSPGTIPGDPDTDPGPPPRPTPTPPVPTPPPEYPIPTPPVPHS